MNILVTGGAGFIGSNFIRYLRSHHPEDHILCLDALTYAGNYDNLRDLENSANFTFVRGNICDRDRVFALCEENRFDCVINFAAESHVDRSIADSRPFLETNITGTAILLDAVNRCSIPRFHQVSTDEVYGDLPADRPDLKFREDWNLKPSSPYSASKAAADLMILAYGRTYGTPATISRCSNNYGPRQFPEKLIPLMIQNALENRPLPVYGDGLNVRDWIYVEDHCRALDLILRRGTPGEIYNVGGDRELTNLEMVRLILKTLDKPESLITFVPDRKGHDRRYGICSEKIRRELDWVPEGDFPGRMAQTIQWYLENRAWLDRIRSGEYRRSIPSP